MQDYVLGKHHQEPFDFGNAWHVLNPLELFHSDLCYISKPSLAGASYVLEFNLSRYTWVYFLNNMSHLFERFKEFRALAEKKYG